MSNPAYRAAQLQETVRISQTEFGITLPPITILFDDIETGVGAQCTLFQTEKNNVYALFTSTERQTLGDVKKQAKEMGLTISGYFFPHQDIRHFSRHGFEAFQHAYPGRKTWTAQEAKYYSTLAPYNPGLVRVKNVRGELRRYNAHNAHWQKAFDFYYSKEGSR